MDGNILHRNCKTRDIAQKPLWFFGYCVKACSVLINIHSPFLQTELCSFWGVAMNPGKRILLSLLLIKETYGPCWIEFPGKLFEVGNDSVGTFLLPPVLLAWNERVRLVLGSRLGV